MNIDYKKLHQFTSLNRRIFDIPYQSNGETKNYLDRFSNRLGEKEDAPFIGYIGERYLQQRVKVVFVGKAGGESSNNDNVVDDSLYETFLEFKNTRHHESGYSNYSKEYKKALENWKISIYIKEFLFHTELNLEDISYFNVVPFRYKGSPLKSVLKIAFHNYASDFLNLVQADMIVPLGTNIPIYDLWNSGYKPWKIFSGISRTNGDTWIDERGRKCLSLCIDDYTHQKRAKGPKLKLIK
jgi:hypothetical protein